jgi:hypothetical protein
VVSSAEGGQPNVHGALVQFQSSPPSRAEIQGAPGAFLVYGDKSSAC